MQQANRVTSSPRPQPPSAPQQQANNSLDGGRPSSQLSFIQNSSSRATSSPRPQDGSSNGLLSTIEQAAQSDDEEEEEQPNYENVSPASAAAASASNVSRIPKLSGALDEHLSTSRFVRQQPHQSRIPVAVTQNGTSAAANENENVDQSGAQRSSSTSDAKTEQ